MPSVTWSVGELRCIASAASSSSLNKSSPSLRGDLRLRGYELTRTQFDSSHTRPPNANYALWWNGIMGPGAAAQRATSISIRIEIVS
jgi:hypothetical protein